MDIRSELTVRKITHSFWFIPGLMVATAVGLAALTVNIDLRHDAQEIMPLDVYSGNAAGARTVLATIAAATIGVAGTVFSITIAALSLASSQMGPRLLENFTRDRGTRISLGTFVATFAYALLVLRTVGTDPPDVFIPQLALTVGVLLAFISTFMLIYFIHHIAESINVTYVIHLVRKDLQTVLENRLLPRGETQATPAEIHVDWTQADIVRATSGGYLQGVQHDLLIAYAVKAGGTLRLLVRPGDYVFPDTPIALVHPKAIEGLEGALKLGGKRTTHQDIEYAVRQLVEIGARALSPGTNDPFTAITVLDRLGDALCSLNGRVLPSGVLEHEGRTRVLMPATTFAGLTDAMFNILRQNGADQPAVMIRLLEVITHAASVLREEDRLVVLEEHARHVRDTALTHFERERDRADLIRRYRTFVRIRSGLLPSPHLDD